MIQDNAHVLEYRINYLMDGMYRKKTSKILMIAVLALPLLTNSIILESAFEPPNCVLKYQIQKLNVLRMFRL